MKTDPRPGFNSAFRIPHSAFERRKERDSNPYTREGDRFSKATRPTVSGSLPYHRRRVRRTRAAGRTPVGRTLFAPRDPRPPRTTPIEWTRGESNPGCRYAIPASYQLDHRPVTQWNRGESNPVAVLARHSPRPRAIPSEPVTGAGVEPALGRLSTCRLYQLAYPVMKNQSRSLGLEPSCQAYETRPSACPPARRSVADLGVEPNIQAYETRSGAGPSAIHSEPVVTVGFEPTLSTF